MLLHFHDGERAYQQFYDFSPRLVPNWLGHVALPILMLLFEPLVAERVFLTIYLLLFVFAIRYFLRSIGPDQGVFAFLALPLVYHFPLFMGFYNFTCSVPLMLLALGFWWRHRDRLFSARVLLGLNLLLVTLYFCHLVSVLATIGSLFALALLKDWRNPQEFLGHIPALSPGMILPAQYFLRGGVGASVGWLPASAADFLGLRCLVAHEPLTEYVGIALGLLYAVLFAHTLVAKALRREPRRSPRDAFLPLVLGFTALYFVLPEHFGEGGFIRDRVALYPFLLVLAWFTPRLAAPLKKAVVVVACLVALVHIALITARLVPVNQELADYTSGVGRVGKNDVLLPVSFDHMVHPGTRISTYLHAAGYYAVRCDCIELDNFEGRYSSSPLDYKPDRDPFALLGPIEQGTGDLRIDRYPVPIDFILLWCPPETFPAKAWIERNYGRVHAQGRMVLYERKGRRQQSRDRPQAMPSRSRKAALGIRRRTAVQADQN
ncbi:MAG: hypothetical protein JXQ29_00145 [Planctomycetes bacterium]|nr:hypothetical protein [Planctomycetota bacterium]